MNARVAPDHEMVEELLALDGASVLDLGCGAAPATRRLAAAHPDASFLGLEVDLEQHAANLRSERPRNLRFGEGGADAIPAADGSFDAVLMFKSLHHVPGERLDRALAEIRRVLRPGGRACIVEPVFAGALNDIIRIFHDEERVRRLALEAVDRAVAEGVFELEARREYLAPVHYRDFAEFERRHIGVTHTSHSLTPAQHAAVRERFSACCGPEGARFQVPMRADVLRRQGDRLRNPSP